MTLFEIVALYVGLNILILLVLSIRVIRLRRGNKISLGHGDNEDLLKAARVHGNFTEYTPMALIGLIVVAYLDGSPLLLHTLGGILTVGRIMHAVAITKGTRAMTGRVGGMMCTFAVLAAEAAFLLYYAIL
jgi:uncharacterized membrane protein YecN with MAPEG domain